MTMTQPWIDLGTGLLAGGLGLSVCWGLFWLVIGSVGWMRGTCSWPVLMNSLVASGIPFLLMLLLAWLRDSTEAPGLALFVGLSIMPLVVVVFGLRRAPDGRLTGTHMLGGVRHLMDKLLGKHQTCGGCGEGHGSRPGGCG